MRSITLIMNVLFTRQKKEPEHYQQLVTQPIILSPSFANQNKKNHFGSNEEQLSFAHLINDIKFIILGI